MTDQTEIQKKYVEFQLLEQQLKQTQKQIQLLEEQLVEVLYTQQSLDELKTLKEDTNILVPVTGGIFADAKLQDTDELIVNVGANTLVRKSIPATKEMLGKQLQELQKLQSQLGEASQKLMEQLQTLEKDISTLMPKEGD